MQVTLVEINVKADKIDEFIEVFRDNHLGSVKEPGNLRFDVLRDENIPTRFYVYEVYADETAVAAHKKTPHYLRCVERLEALMTEPRKKTTFIGLMPEGK
ncbi:(4S)-4-hydroxy-5-phosphonooxypentane-2,3-dione isomerase [Xenorhabdus bovienii]|uniref:(4S)-4-hydroxy-5-phosphonooxypentane-2,3-dione isomerase n=1 Tax=Xenorhabdus bovienii TaxID=40576 RepID=UPI001EDE74F3|nr:(4S)-4-hydroxy-5-phosphonooxypentane-2,3-dione isomerase [Xenorhabdus bovienii]MCG3463253.1 (4S)-4-hydroxy-5-phosphonooxypentane-2,3-dione isomerase [Xenorhabdus bovienii]